MTTLRVATLETLFTADDSGLVATVDRARQTTRDLDGSHAEVQVDADADAAAADLDRIADAARDLDGTRSEVEVRADVDGANQDLDTTTDQLAGIDGDTATVHVDADVEPARENLARAGEMTGEFRDEARSNFAEVTSSFSGDMTSIADLAQGTLGGLAGSLTGPLGIALGAAAVGVGAIVGKLQDAADKASEFRAETSALTKELIDADGALDDIDFAGKLQDWLGAEHQADNWFTWWTNELTTNLQAVEQAARDAGVSIGDYLGALSEGDVEEAARVLDGYHDRLTAIDTELGPLERKHDAWVQAINAGVPATVDWSNAEDERLSQLRAERDGLDALMPKLDEHIEQVTTATHESDLLAAVPEGITTSLRSVLA